MKANGSHTTVGPVAAATGSPWTMSHAETPVAVGVIVVAALAAYLNSFRGPFVFDDVPGILLNPSIRRLWPPWEAFALSDAGLTVSGRPVGNLSFAVNYALSGTNVWSYHVLNLFIHILSGLTLFGIIRRTLLQRVLHRRFDQDALHLALAIALLWTLHPLQTEAVTYVVQRVESMMGLFYLISLYSFVRSMDSPRPFRWQLCVVAACLFGVATKEVMATAPFLVLLYDRTFAAGSFRQALRQRRWMYLGLAATWIPLAWLVARTGWNRGGSAGFFGPVAPWEYWLTQFEAVTRYLWLSVWPHPLVFEYGPLWVHQFAATAICAFVVGSLAVATIVALWRWPVWGFLGAWFFVILAPTSVVPIANQWIVEYRMYLPLAAVMTLVALGIRAATGRQSWTLLALLVLVLGVHTSRRNEDYRSDLAIWTDTVAKRPENVVAQVNLGLSLEHAGLIQEAMQHYAEALRIDPNLVQAHIDLGNLLFGTQRTSEAIRQYAIALTISPNDAQTHHGLGVILDQVGRTAEAIQHYTEALRLNPDLVNAHNNLGVDLCDCGRVAEAIAHFKEALRLRSDYAEARNNLGNALVQAGRIDEAVAEYEEVMRLRPDDPDARRVLGLIRTGRLKKPAPGN